MTTPFVHLHCHSEFSPLDGLCRVSELVAEAERHNMPAIALTDHGNIAGAPEFYYEARANDVVPIMGQEFYIVPDTSIKDPKEDEFIENKHIILLALNLEGWRTLVELSSIANKRENYHYKPRVDYNMLREYDFTNIAVLTACLNSEINNGLRDSMKQADRIVRRYKRLFPNLYLELQRHGRMRWVENSDLQGNEDLFHRDQERYNKYLVRASSKFEIPLVITNDTHYARKDQHDIHDLLLSMQTKKEVAEEERFRFSGTGYHIKSTKEMSRLWKDKPAVWSASQRNIEELCEGVASFSIPEFEAKTWHIPNMPGFDEDPAAYIKRKCIRRLRKLGLWKNKEYRQRLKHELKVIREANFEQIFVIVEDYVNWAREQGIIVGPGRGSMVGVLVSYLLGITEIDPIRYRLLFERAINPARPSIPDFDIDFENERIEEVIDYVREKYGDDNVMLIGTHMHMAPRMTFKNIMRSLGVPFQQANKITGDLPDSVELVNNKAVNDIDYFFKSTPELKQMGEDHEILQPAADAMNGLLRSYGTHAAGVIISDPDRSVQTEVPTMLIPSSGKRVSQYDMEAVKKIHFVKFDFLRLSTLKSIAKAIEYIGHDPLAGAQEWEDPEVFEMMSQGHLETIFQYQGGAARQCIMEMGVTSFEDLVAVNALARPGAINFLAPYIEGKRNPKRIKYSCKEVRPILEYTYGVILYQEQVMEIVKELAGWDDLGADEIKEAIKSKSGDKFDKMRPDFIRGCGDNGISEKAALEIWKNIDDYRSYGFNRAHAVAYSAIGYHTAYLKRHYPKEWLCAVLNTTPDKNMQSVIDEVRRLRIGLLPPDVNKSDYNFSLAKRGIRFGLQQIRGIGEKASAAIIGERGEGGKFVSVRDFKKRMSDYPAVNNIARMRTIEQSGAYGSIGGDEATMEDEEKLLGTYVTKHPLDKYRKRLDDFIFSDKNVAKLKNDLDDYVNVGGMVTKVNQIVTRKGDPMAFVKLSYYGESWECTVFPNIWQKMRKPPKVNDVMIFRAQKDMARRSFIVQDYRVVSNAEA